MKKFDMSLFPVTYYAWRSIREGDESLPDMWKDLGITLGMAPRSGEKDAERILALLDRSQELGIRVLLCDSRADFGNLNHTDEKTYRENVKKIARQYGSHPALFGLFIGDEPTAKNLDNAMLAYRICQECLPEKVTYVNLLPWLNGIGETMGAENLESYLDRWAKEVSPKLFSYDCYAQMNENSPNYDIYFHNLRHYKEAFLKYNIPFFNIVLSVGHWDYCCPTKDDLMWQFNTSVACGAAGISWYYVEMVSSLSLYNERNAPINVLGERTESFAWLSEINRVFNAYYGKIFAELNIDSVYMSQQAFGGFPEFEPFGCAKKFESDHPAILSRFYDDDGREYYAMCSNSRDKTVHVNYEFDCSLLERCEFGNRFVVDNDKIRNNRELYPGQLVLYRVTP